MRLSIHPSACLVSMEIGLKEVNDEKYRSIPSSFTARNPDNQSFLIFY